MKLFIEPELKNILADNTSGSADLLLKLNLFLKKKFGKAEDLKICLRLLDQHFITFQSVNNYLKKLKLLINKNKLTIDFFDNFITNNISAYDNIFEIAFNHLKDKNTILTISNSRTVFELLKRLSKRNKKLLVVVCESRPKFEGRILAQKLAGEKIKVELITEAAAAPAIHKCDCILIGADSILKNCDVINKSGSLTLAVLCKYYGKPFFAAAEKTKLSGNAKFAQRKEPSDEIWNHPPKSIKVENFYFEKIPHGLITKIFTA